MEHNIEHIFPFPFERKKRFRLSRRDRHSWVEESFLIDQPIGRHRPLPASNRYVGNSFLAHRFRGAFFVVLLTFTLLIGRIVYLQIMKGGTYAAFAEHNRQRVIPIPSERGLVLDRNGTELIKNIPSFSLALVPQDLPRDKAARENVVARLATLIGRKEEDVRVILEEYGSYSYESIVIQEKLSYDEALRIHIEAGDLPGISIHRGSRRLYTNGESATSTLETGGVSNSLSHVLGYEGKLNREELDALYDQGYLPSDTIGKTGIEKSYESYLRGTYGSRRIEVDASGREQFVIAEEAPVPGSHVRLAIDLETQHALERIMSDELKRQGKTRASGIVLDPKNGEVLALVSLPTFNNNDFSGGISVEQYQQYLEDKDQPLFHRAIAGTYPSGSTIKPIIAAIALHEGIITPNTTILSTGGIWVGPWFFPDWKAGGHGQTNVRSSIAWSINTFYYHIVGGYLDFVGMGIDVLRDYLLRLGLGQPLGIDIPGEAGGFVPSPEWKEETLGEQWYIGDTYNTSIGQGYTLVTPLQIAALTGAIANGGTVYAPRLVAGLQDSITKEAHPLESRRVAKDVLDPNALAVAANGMRDCVVYGSCRLLSMLPFPTAGKTGTAQWHSEKENHAWFTSFAPYENPEIVVTILVEEGGEGAESATPIAYQFYRWWWQHR